jgi:Multimeric flavodoxin WrbA
MKKLFIYYSLSGSGDTVAEKLKERGYDVRKVQPSKNPPKLFFLQILKCGCNAGRGICEPLLDYDADVSAYDEIVVGSPVWNGRLSCPINTVLKETKLDGKKLTFVLYSGSGEGPKAAAKIKESFPDAPILFLKEPKKNPETLSALAKL